MYTDDNSATYGALFLRNKLHTASAKTTSLIMAMSDALLPARALNQKNAAL
jgi:hypothetical protein